MIRALSAALAVSLLPGIAMAEKQPADANLLNVTDPLFGAIPDDGLDDYPAIKLAMGIYDGFNGNTLYFPCGQYDFFDTVEWRDWPTVIAPGIPISPVLGTEPDTGYGWAIGMPWMGEDRDCVTIKLADNATGFDDPQNPKSFLITGSLVGPGPSLEGLGGGAGGNGAYQHWFEDLTIDCGSGNPGVRCMDWLASNAGELRRVRVRSGDGQGHSGVYMSRPWPGPAMLLDVDIEGFDYGIHLLQPQYSITFYKVRLSDQNVVGAYVGGNMATFEILESDQGNPDVPALLNDDGGGQIAILNSTLSGNSATRSAIEAHGSGKYYLENVTTSGYASAVKRGEVVTEVGPNVAQSTSHLPYKLYNAPDASLDLPYEELPDPFWSDPDTNPSDWANVLDYGAGPGDGGEVENDVAGIQAAMDSGRPIVYFPKLSERPSGQPPGGDATYAHRGPTITVPGTVRRVLFNRNSMYMDVSAYPTETDCVYTVIGDENDPPVEFNWMRRTGDQIAPAKHICNKSDGRTVVIRSSPSNLAYGFFGENKSFVLDVIGDVTVKDGAKLYMWQHNQERVTGTEIPGTVVEGAGSQFRSIGMKTEGNFPVAWVLDGARYKMIGGFIFPCIGTGTNPVTAEGFLVENSQASMSFLQYCTKNPAIQDYIYPNAVRQTIAASSRVMKSTDMVNFFNCCSNRNYTPLFNAYPDADFIQHPTVTSENASAKTWSLVNVDATGTNGVAIDPGQWTQPVDCSAYSRVQSRVQRMADTSNIDVDIYSCNDIGPDPGTFDPALPSTLLTPTDCINLTEDVELTGLSGADTHLHTGHLGQIMARVRACDSGCAATVSVSCSGAAINSEFESASSELDRNVEALLRSVNSAILDGMFLDLSLSVPRTRRTPLSFDEFGVVRLYRPGYESSRRGSVVPAK